MKRLTLLLLVFVLVIWPGMAYSASKIGVVDGEKLFDEYPQAQSASQKIADAQDKLRDIITESEKQFAELEKQDKSEGEKLVKQRELQAKIDAEATQTRELIESISADLEDDILQSIQAVSTKKGIDVVLDKRAVLIGGTDITEEVSAILKGKKKKTAYSKK